jgi:NAD(P)-dependent dehydrogenase (short-subunit alcohol dehydrogenase family)
MTKTWLITGAAGGLGQRLVQAVLEKGHNVLAADLRPGSTPDVPEEHRARLRSMALDVTDAGAAHDAVRRALASFGALDVVVNGAGYRRAGSIEDMPDEEFRRIMETNLFGAVNVVRAALPVLRPQRSGHIIQISTIGGRRAQPGLGAYQTSKWALGGFSEILAREVDPLGIHVTAVEPGGIRTPWAAEPLTDPAEDGIREEYAPTVGAFTRAYQHNPDVQRGDPLKMARAIVHVTEVPHPPVRLLLGSDAAWLAPLIARARADEDATWRHLSVSTDLDGLPAFCETPVARLVRPPEDSGA